ncbi:putative Ca(2) cation antiporter (CaCA) (TC 2.A.19) family protein [Lyophyllum shimeji]|uniref:Ca(2) cation antiporter (CaCA) (TC 2.A.19) family protein n=1 Tax=Lyophyllum shimeji TaxID=47721 RepID=A0A9P3PDK3_LYOSH|nr:putative Ca(2) cation antiporter (CaCA) (TC 2.A.19) family protein [Lyophyllum shimeji]
MPTPPARTSTPSRDWRPYSVGHAPPVHNGVEILWSDAESQSSSDTVTEEQGGRMAKVSKLFPKPLTLWEKLKGKGRTKVTWAASMRAFLRFSWLNVLLIFIPIAWGMQRTNVSHIAKFMLCFVAIMPLSKILDYGGEQLALYCGRASGDLIIITINNAVETSLAIVLLTKCELKLLQSTVTGVVLLRLLLVPGSAFLTGGARVLTQELHPHIVSLNNTLLTIGALTLLLPAAFFSALDRTVAPETIGVFAAVSDSVRGDFLKLSRALAVFMLVIYVGSRFYLHKPPGDSDSLHEHPDAPASFKADVAKLEEEEPALNPWFCVVVLIITVALLGVTSEFLVSNVKPMRKMSGIKEEWFGIFLLPLVSYSADGILSTVYFVMRHIKQYRGDTAPLITELAQGRSIDLGIQFMLFWLPFLVLVAWFSHKPLSLLFDIFEVAVLLGACFLVNHVTSDAKTNWVEGLMMVIFYLTIATTVWFYPGQTDVQHMLACTSVQASIAAPPKSFVITGKPIGVQPPNSQTQEQAQAQESLNHAELQTLNARLQRLLDMHDVLREKT